MSLAVCSFALTAAVVGRMWVGSQGFALPEPEILAAVLDLRALRAVMGVIVGGALGVAGVVLQSLLRNPLAGPDVLGVSAGASLAVVLTGWLGTGAIVTVAPGAGTIVWHAGPAIIGSLVTLGVVYLLAQRRGLVEPVHLVLTGVVIGVMCGAGIMLTQHLSGGMAIASPRALIGELSDDWDWSQVLAFAGITSAATLAAAIIGPTMDAASLGDDEAISIGVRLSRHRAALFVLAGTLTASAVALAGPVGFIGLVAPHVARLLIAMRAGHRGLIVLSFLIGACIVVSADTLIKAIHLGAGRMPLGILTAALGGPVLLLLLRRQSGSAHS